MCKKFIESILELPGVEQEKNELIQNYQKVA